MPSQDSGKESLERPVAVPPREGVLDRPQAVGGEEHVVEGGEAVEGLGGGRGGAWGGWGQPAHGQGRDVSKWVGRCVGLFEGALSNTHLCQRGILRMRPSSLYRHFPSPCRRSVKWPPSSEP